MDRSVVSRWVIFGSFLAGLVLFVWVHVGNFVEAQRLMLSRSVAGPEPFPSLFESGAVALAPAAAQYLVFALAGWAIARATASRVLWLVPALVMVLSPLPGALLVGEGALVRPIGPFWYSWTWPVWLSSLLDLGLVTLPGLATVMFGRRGARRRFDGSSMVAVAAVGALAVILYLMARYRESGTFDVNVEAHLVFLALFLTGSIVGARSAGLLWPMLLIGVLASEAPWLVSNWFSGSMRPAGWGVERLLWESVRSAFPALTAVGLGVLCDPLAGYLRRRRDLLASTAAPQPS